MSARTEALARVNKQLGYGYFQSPDRAMVYQACPECREDVQCVYLPWLTVRQRVDALRTVMIEHMLSEHESVLA